MRSSARRAATIPTSRRCATAMRRRGHARRPAGRRGTPARAAPRTVRVRCHCAPIGTSPTAIRGSAWCSSRCWPASPRAGSRARASRSARTSPRPSARPRSRRSAASSSVARARTCLPLMSRRLDDVRLAALMLDGIDLKGRCCVVPLGIKTDGTKIPSGRTQPRLVTPGRRIPVPGARDRRP